MNGHGMTLDNRIAVSIISKAADLGKALMIHRRVTLSRLDVNQRRHMLFKDTCHYISDSGAAFCRALRSVCCYRLFWCRCNVAISALAGSNRYEGTWHRARYNCLGLSYAYGPFSFELLLVR